MRHLMLSRKIASIFRRILRLRFKCIDTIMGTKSVSIHLCSDILLDIMIDSFQAGAEWQKKNEEK